MGVGKANIPEFGLVPNPGLFAVILLRPAILHLS